ncbi:hypothetical protein ACP70R_022084 [Stipagrostis hirtigluma subsp. patula]
MFREYKSRLAEHLGAVEAQAVVSGVVYAISIGTNDFIEKYFALTTTQLFLEFTAAEYTAYLVGLARAYLADLYALGAQDRHHGAWRHWLPAPRARAPPRRWVCRGVQWGAMGVQRGDPGHGD